MTKSAPGRKKKFYKRKRFYMFLLLSLVLVNLHSCMQFRTSDKETQKYFKEAAVPATIEYLRIHEQKEEVRVVTSGVDNPKAVIFIHGAPGSADAFYGYLADSALVKDARLITFDRPGYGYSGFGDAMTSITEQAEVVKEIIDHYQLKNVILVGHSYGGPIAAYVPLLSDKVQSVLLLAPAMDPDHEKYFWVSNFAKWKLSRWMVPTSWKVSADEKHSHAQELQKMVNDWKKVSVPVKVIQGTKDRLVPFENLHFCETHFNAAILDTIVLEGEDHFIPWSNKGLVVDELEKMLNPSQINPE